MTYVWLIENDGVYFGGDGMRQGGGWDNDPWHAARYATKAEAQQAIWRNHGQANFEGAVAVEHGFADEQPGPGEETTPSRLYRETGGGQAYFDAMVEHGFLVKVPSAEECEV